MPEDTQSSRVELRADVGVLLVHGIGDHAEADTLLGFGEPLVDWLREWLRGSRGAQPRGRLNVRESLLRARRDEAESPAHAVVDIEVGSAAETWLFAESWWGDSVRPPRALQLLMWMFSRLPLLVAWHYFGGRRGGAGPVQEIHRPRRLTWNTPVPHFVGLAAKVLMAPLLVLAMQCAVLIAAMLWLVPFGPWRNAVLAAVRVMTLTLGDSFVLLEQDIQRAALVERVRRSLDWLQARVTRVVVIAHSQGGAIAHDALLGAKPIQAFISVGSGLEKLEFLRLVRNRRRGLRAAAIAAPAASLGLLGLLAGWLGWAGTGAGWWIVPVALILVGWFATYRLADVLQPYRDELADALDGSAVARGTTVAHWYDVYATLDLVPMGRASLLPVRPNVERMELRNECSLVSDHVTYFESRCGFVSWCWSKLAEQSRLELMTEGERAGLQQLGLWHARRAFGLGLGSALSPIAVLVGGFLFTDLMYVIGSTLLATLDGTELTWTARAAHWTIDSLARMVGALPGLLNTPAAIAYRGPLLLGALAAAGAVLLWWLLVVAAWRWDSRARWRAASRGLSTLTGRNSAWIGAPMVLLWCLISMFPLLAVLLAAQSAEVFSLAVLGRAMALVVAPLFAAMAWLAGAGYAWWTLGDAELEILKRRGHPGWPLLTGTALMFWGYIANGAWQIGTGFGFPDGLVTVALASCALSWLLAVTIKCRPGVVLSIALWTLPVLATTAAWTLGARWSGPAWAALHLISTLALVGLVRWRALRST